MKNETVIHFQLPEKNVSHLTEGFADFAFELRFASVRVAQDKKDEWWSCGENEKAGPFKTLEDLADFISSQEDPSIY